MNIESPNLTGYIFPQSIEIEEAILSGLLNDSSAINIVGQILKPDDFYLSANRIIFEAICNLYVQNRPIELLTVNEELNRLSKLEEIGGLGHLIQISQMVANTSNIEYWSQIVLEKSQKRQMIQISTKTIKQCFEDTVYAGDIRIENNIGFELLAPRGRKISLSEMQFQIIEESTSKTVINGILSGFSKQDDITNGLRGLTVMAARPGEGKSVRAINIAKHVSKTHKVLLFTLEMSYREVVLRLMSDVNNLTVQEIERGQYNVDKVSSFDIEKHKLIIDDRATLTIDDIVGISKQCFLGETTGLIIIDYLQLITKSSLLNKNVTKNEYIGDMTRKLKILSKTIGIPIIALSQLNRGKDRKYYQLEDLRDSGEIEQDADNVIFIFRPVIHNLSTYEFNGTDIIVDPTTAIINIAKHRNGDTGIFRETFKGMFMRFEDYKEDNFTYGSVDFSETKVNQKGDPDNVPF